MTYNPSWLGRATPKEREELEAEWQKKALNPPTNPDLLCPKCSDFRRDWIDWCMPDGSPTGEYSYRCVNCGHEWNRCGDDS
jgi:hypothetical protein